MFGCCIAAVLHRRKKWSRRRWQERGPGSSRSRPPSWSLSFSYRRWNVFLLSASFQRPKSNGRHSRWILEKEISRQARLDSILISGQANASLVVISRTVLCARSHYRYVLRNSTREDPLWWRAAHVRLDDGIVPRRLFTRPPRLAWVYHQIRWHLSVISNKKLADRWTRLTYFATIVSVYYATILVL